MNEKLLELKRKKLQRQILYLRTELEETTFIFQDCLVEFEGELLSDHPYLDYELTDRKVLGPIQYFNYPDDWTD